MSANRSAFFCQDQSYRRSAGGGQELLMSTLRRVFHVVAGALAVLVLSGSVQAQEVPDSAPNRFVMRISREFLRRHLSPTLEETRPVNRCLFGARVIGETTTNGATSITMDLSEKDAKFVLRFTGASVSKTLATKSIVEVCTTSTTQFVAERIVSFDGIRFTEEPATIQATTSSTTDAIMTPRGLIGRIARKRAGPEIEANRPEADRITLEDTKKIVMDRFDAESSRFTKEMNGIIPYEKTVALLLPKTQGWIIHLGSTKDFLMVSPGPVDNYIPQMPKSYGRMKGAIEVWVRGKADNELSRRAMETWALVNTGLDRFRPKQTGKMVEGVKVTTIEGWWVLKIGEDLADDLIESNLDSKKD